VKQTAYPSVTREVLERILDARFEAEGFLSLKDLPHPSQFKDMERATARIVTAIEQGEKITIIGDYDVDGVTATTLMHRFFGAIAYPVAWIIPNRFRDGYGLSLTLLEQLPPTDLIITVDNGIAAVEAGRAVEALGIDLIITDHHLLPDTLPPAYAIINPKQPECPFPYEEVCGAQIAWYLIASLKNALGIRLDMMGYMELVSLAIIADMMPLQHINRAMVIAGLRHLSGSQHPAITCYKEHVNKSHFTEEDIGFFLAPLLNSAGRMDDASHAVAFLGATTHHEARIGLDRLLAFNDLRKETESALTQEALAQVTGEDEVLVLVGEGWHEGVVGIVAARVARIHQKPTIILSQSPNGLCKGSGRSFDACDLFAITSHCRALLEKFGGHEAAIGLSLKVENLPAFREAINHAYTHSSYPTQQCDPEIVGVVELRELSFEMTTLMKRYEPYGMANPRPKFLSCAVRICEVATMGSEGNHLRFTLEQGGVRLRGVKFKTYEQFEVGAWIDVSYHLSENHFRGSVTLQLVIDTISISNIE